MLSKLQLWLIVGVAALTLLGGIVYAIRRDAQKDLIDDLNQRNTEAGDSADTARSRFDTCPPGMWDYGRGRCRGTSPRGGN